MEEIMVYQLEIKGQPTIVFKTLSDLMLNLESFTEDELTDTTGDIDVKISSKQMTEEEYEGLLEFQGY